MRPTQLELDLGALVVECRWTAVTAEAQRLSAKIETRWYNNEPYVRTSPCQHSEVTTRWSTPEVDQWRGRKHESTCNECGENVNIFGEEN